jgi:hypothetical protein
MQPKKKILNFTGMPVTKMLQNTKTKYKVGNGPFRSQELYCDVAGMKENFHLNVFLIGQ